MPDDGDSVDHVPGPLARALDLLNFLLADVRDGLGPYLSIYPLLTHHWDQAVTAATGIGAAVSNLAAGSIVVAAGYPAAFAALGALAAAGLVLYLVAMPETAPTGSGVPNKASGNGARGFIRRT